MVDEGMRLPALENPDDGLHRRDYYSRSLTPQADSGRAAQEAPAEARLVSVVAIILAIARAVARSLSALSRRVGAR